MCVADAGEEGSVPAITLLEPRTKQPEIYTSYQVFQKVLELSPESDESGCIDFVVHKYRLNPYQPLLFVTPVSASDPRQFLSSFPTLSRKVQTRLPFGLPRPAKPSKPRKKRKLVDPPLENTVARTARSSSQQTIAGHPVSACFALVGLADSPGSDGVASDTSESESEDDCSSSARDSSPSGPDEAAAPSAHAFATAMTGGAEVLVCTDNVLSADSAAEIRLQSGMQREEEQELQRLGVGHAIATSLQPDGVSSREQDPAAPESNFFILQFVVGPGGRWASRWAAAGHLSSLPCEN